jgi:hypothetical protein
MKFSTVTGYNLSRQEVTLPDDLSAELTVIFIAFERWQQSWVDSWLPFIKTLETKQPSLAYYELPTIRSMNFLSRTFINEGMRMGIPDQTARDRTVTLYLDKEGFKRSLNIVSESTITVLLLSKQGEILWRTTGKFTPEQGLKLADKVRCYTSAYQGSAS